MDTTTLPAGIGYLPRAKWGLTDAVAFSRGLTSQPKGQPEIYFHHTAGAYPDQTAAEWDDDPVKWAQWIDRYAREVKGYKAPDYSWAIHTGSKGTTIIELRERFYPAATLDRNSVSKAIVFVGNYDRSSASARKPTWDEIVAAQWLVTQMRHEGIVSAAVAGRPHRDNPAHPNATSCCGSELIPFVPAFMRPWQPVPMVPSPVLTLGDKNPGVAHLKDHLRFWGYFTSPRSSQRFGLVLRNSLRRFQKAIGAPATGVYDQATARAYEQWVRSK